MEKLTNTNYKFPFVRQSCSDSVHVRVVEGGAAFVSARSVSNVDAKKRSLKFDSACRLQTLFLSDRLSDMESR